ncbi:MAG: hypothetical protein QW343_03365 [Candidatus Norongarragalinales archaeon]
MKIVVLTCEEDDVLLRLAREITEGVREANENSVLIKNTFEESIADAELVFFGFTTHRKLFWSYASERAVRALRENAGSWKEKKLALFAVCYGEAARSAMADAVREASAVGARVVNTLAVVAQRTRQGGWEASEIDLARARGFGERTTNNAKGVAVFRPSEKQRIKKYLR